MSISHAWRNALANTPGTRSRSRARGMGLRLVASPFTAFIPSASAGQFSNPQQYEGKTVAVSGKITLYRGKPEIIESGNLAVES
jgi:hypothetical protein